MRRLHPVTACVCLILMGGIPVMAQAEAQPAVETGQSENIVVLNGNSGTNGRAAVNAAAGNLNQQANVGVIAIGDAATATGSVTQTSNVASAFPASGSALIEGNAFAGSNGMIAVNIAAGSANQQANLAVIAIGIEGRVATDAMLSQTRASSSPSGESAEPVSPEVAAGISPGAFAGSSGLVQVSLVGGERNSSANLFVLTSSAGTDQ